jgi:N-hydroxyarylamine O-acetyltransferase
MTADFTFDLDRYFARIGFAGSAKADLETLRALHRAHVTHVPFENLDVLLGRTIRLDLPHLEHKLVGQRRGGYCFEQNGLFTAVLEQIGFKITRLAARRTLPNRLLPRTHMLFLAEVDGAAWMGDVGFGGFGLIEPIRLVAGVENRQYGWTFRLIEESGVWTLQCAESALLGRDQYAFTLEPQFPVDYEPANHYCSTHPESRFVLTLTAQLSGTEARLILRNREFVTLTPAGEETRVLTSNEELLQVLKERFGLSFPAGTVFGPTEKVPPL